MSSLIGFKKEQKLAILRIMIEIANHYSSKLSNATQVINNTAIIFDLPYGVSEAYLMRIFDANNILQKCFKNKNKELFFSQLLSFMLRTEQLSNIYNRMTDPQNGRTESQRNKDKARLSTQFRQEWGYAFDLTREILKDYKLAFTNINPFESKEFTFISVENPSKKSHSTSYLDENIQQSKKIKKYQTKLL